LPLEADPYLVAITTVKNTIKYTRNMTVCETRFTN